MNPIAMTLLVATLSGLFALSALRRAKLLSVGHAEDRTDRLWERLTTAPGERGPSVFGAVLVFLTGFCLALVPGALMGGLAGGSVGAKFLSMAGVAAAAGGGLGLFWALRAQLKMPKYPLAGIAHYAIFTGFATLLLRTIILVGRGFDEGFNLWVLDPFSSNELIAFAGRMYNHLRGVVVLGVLFGVVMFIKFRLVDKMKRLAYGWHAWVVLGVIGVMMLADVLYDGGHILSQALGGARVAGENMVFDPNNPAVAIDTLGLGAGDDLGWVLARAMLAVGVGANAAHFLGAVGFWTHVSLVLLFLNYLPYGKHFHVIVALPNVLFRNMDPPGRLPLMAPTADALLESMTTAMEQPDPTAARIGVARIDHFTWKSLLDFYTCTECGRCSDNCPAHRTGKLLSPKHLTIDLRDHLYEHQEAVASSLNDPSVSLFNTPVVPDIIHPDVIWACTTCRACEEQCPVMITYVDKIVDMRRNLVMVKGEFPAELQKTFTALETNGNPWNITKMDRAQWADGLDVALMSDKPDADVLYWVGCAASYDDRAKKIARATVKLLQQAKVDFAILGTEETCTGDPARRAGNEHLFLMLAEQNVAALNQYKPKKIVTTCPHCFNTLLNEYPDLGARYEVVHHTDFLLGLLSEGRLKATRGVSGRVAFHDSCYLGRYNGVYEPPREILKRIPGLELVEAEWSREKGLCCGAGGAQMWMEEQHSAERVNTRRTLQLVNTGADIVASGCPFCQTMLTDGIKGMEDTLKKPVQQLDVAEVLERAVAFDAPAKAAPADAPAEA